MLEQARDGHREATVGHDTRKVVVPVTTLEYHLTSKRKEEVSMSTLATTRMSSKGQVVIPEQVRTRLGLETGARFVVVGENDVVILKTISPPSMRDFDSIIRRARQQARASGMKPSDVTAAVAKVRGRK